MEITFSKMHGLGNDFVVIDAVNQTISLSAEQIRLIADRHFGIGCDQLLLVERPLKENADFKYRIFNADGGEVAQCGNGARCFAYFVRLKKLSTKDQIVVDTLVGQLVLSFDDNGMVTVNMGMPKFHPGDIPLIVAEEAILYELDIAEIKINFAALSMGNPHAVIQVDDVSTAELPKIGAKMENHPIFPERANIGFMQIINRHRLKLRVYERGAGETLACGSGACAAVVAGREQQLLAQEVLVELPGGELIIKWQGRGYPVFMTGPAVLVYEGKISI